MRLKRLTCRGFKSFADRTEFVFDQRLTGIIGPNGCGKSNVVDALKWVLGDQRAKSLRSSEMTDVIFKGAEGRDAMGLSDVRVVLEVDADSATAEALLAHAEAKETDGSIEVEMTAGFGADWSGIPADLKQAILSMAGEFWGQNMDPEMGIPFSVSVLLEPHRALRLRGAAS